MKRCRDGALPVYIDLCFHASSLPCLHTFWHAIPTSFYIFNVFIFLFLYFFGVILSYMQLDPSLRSVFSSVQVVTTTDGIDSLIVVTSMYINKCVT